NMEILGLVENMVAVKCPHCGEYFNLFEGQNSAKAMNDFGVKLLGKVDFDKKITEASDNGEAYIYHNSLMPAGKQLQAIVDNIINTVEA
ncbi:MAG TPA: P-loop NTPase, partial [Candidatus Cloacimonadota bacterium]|nr:P-loop NTPase [Candidatus Cloacimonadota bacterium]